MNIFNKEFWKKIFSKFPFSDKSKKLIVVFHYLEQFFKWNISKNIVEVFVQGKFPAILNHDIENAI